MRSTPLLAGIQAGFFFNLEYPVPPLLGSPHSWDLEVMTQMGGSLQTCSKQELSSVCISTPSLGSQSTGTAPADYSTARKQEGKEICCDTPRQTYLVFSGSYSIDF